MYRTHCSPTWGSSRSLELTESGRRFELAVATTDHHHIVCVRCGHTEEFEGDPVLQAEGKQRATLRFELLESSLNVRGIARPVRPFRQGSFPEHRPMSSSHQLLLAAQGGEQHHVPVMQERQLAGFLPASNQRGLDAGPRCGVHRGATQLLPYASRDACRWKRSGPEKSRCFVNQPRLNRVSAINSDARQGIQ